MRAILKRNRWPLASVLGALALLSGLQLFGLIPSNIASMTSLAANVAPANCSWDGWWNTSRGVIMLEQSTRDGHLSPLVSGKMGPELRDTISGNWGPVLDHNEFTGDWAMPYSSGQTGRFQFVFGTNCNSFTSAIWWTGGVASDTPWTGTRTEEPGFCRFDKPDRSFVGRGYVGYGPYGFQKDTWSTNRGPMTLTQSIKSVGGAFGSATPNGVTGTLTNGVLDGKWFSGSQRGGFRITLSEDCDSFTGTFGNTGPFGNTLSSGAGYWSGTRSGVAPTPTPNPAARPTIPATVSNGPCNMSGTWSTNHGTMVLNQVYELTGGTPVTGTYGIGGTISGSTPYMQPVVTGEWRIASASGRFRFTTGLASSASSSCSTFTGTWGHGSSETDGGTWTGTKG